MILIQNIWTENHIFLTNTNKWDFSFSKYCDKNQKLFIILFLCDNIHSQLGGKRE
jgi:hypothetical protein